jgi:aldose 1-epimerase
MFEFDIVKSDQGDTLRLQHKHVELEALFSLDQGASLQSLKIKGEQVIKLPHNWSYKDCYASAILFPFANRIEDGAYVFDGHTYHLDKNEKSSGHAIHGLLADKSFKLISSEMKSDYAELSFGINAKELHRGFPYPFQFLISYFFNENSLRLSFEIKNTGEKSFPFSLGWHPYFNIDFSEKESLDFEYTAKAEISESGITQRMNMEHTKASFDWNKVVDDCFLLSVEPVKWKSKDIEFKMVNSGFNFLQVFSIPEKEFIAVEPVTAPSNSFNNGIGLEVLPPGESFKCFCELSWTKTLF